MLKKIVSCVLFFHVAMLPVCADINWTVTTPAPMTATPNTVNENVSSSFDPTTGRSLAVWVDTGNGRKPTYSFYTPGTGSGSGWSAPVALDSAMASSDDVFSACNPSTGEIMATWAVGNVPTYSIYTPGMGWSPTVEQIPTASTVPPSYNVTVSFNSITGKFLAVWTNNTPLYPTYAFYTPNVGWETSTISTNMTYQVEGNVFSVSNSINGTTMAAWSDLDSSFPVYSTYTGTGPWSDPAYITDSILFQNVYLSFNSITGQTLATWTDNTGTSFPTSYLYTPSSPSAGSWSSSPITFPGTTQPYRDVTSGFDPVTGQFLAVWSDMNNSFQVTYSFYTDGSWGDPATISNSSESTATENVFVSYDSLTGQFLATWATNAGDPNHLPFYSFFDGPAPPPPNPTTPAAPASFSGRVINNHFLAQTDRVNKLSWIPANDPTITSYVLRRNGVLVYMAPAAGPYTYEDHNRKKNVTYVYTLTSKNQNGVESAPLTVTLE